jgi:hypothetical protein
MGIDDGIIQRMEEREKQNRELIASLTQNTQE